MRLAYLLLENKYLYGYEVFVVFSVWYNIFLPKISLRQ